MDNTETKKKTKIAIFNIVMVGIIVLLFGLYIYLKIVGRELYLFGYVWGRTDISNLYNVLVCAWVFIPWIDQPKSTKRRNILIFGAIIFVFEIGLVFWSVYGNIKDTADTERITLSDGNKIFLNESMTYSKFDEKKFEHTYMEAYQIKGITAKVLGGINESYFSNKCLSQDKYSYEYDEAGKKLTVICEHGSASLEEQNGTGFWSEEFTLE